MKFVMIFLALLSFSSFASDHWDNCSSADGMFVLENGEIVKPEKNEEENYVLGKLLKKIDIKEESETYVLEGSKKKMISMEQTFSFEVYQMSVGESKFQTEFLCVRGGSGIPASENCDEKTAKKTVKYLVK